MPSESLLGSGPGLLLAQTPAQPSVQRASSAGTVAVLDTARTPAMASVAGPRPRMRCPPIRFRRPGPGGPAPSGVRPVRCPVAWFVVQDPVSGRLLSTRPVSSPLVSAPVGPDASVWSPIRWWRLGIGRCGKATRATGTGSGPGGLPGRRAARVDGEQARTGATPPRSRMVGGAVGGGSGPGRLRAAAGLDAGLPGQARPACGPPSQAAALWAREEAAAEVAAPPPGCRPRMGGRPRCVVVVAPAARVDGPGGADGLAGGDGRAAPARPRLAASVPGLLPTAL